MISYRIAVGIGALLTAAAVAATPLSALSMRECSAAYKDAKSSGTLAGMSWQDFRKAKCGATASTGAKSGAQAGAKPKSETRAGAQTAVPPATGPSTGGSGYLPTGRMIFPSTVLPKYADAPPGKARWQTCLDQYRLNKASDANGGLKWVQKGGGYYSECNKRLKAVRKH